jgi:hypothetical protein
MPLLILGLILFLGVHSLRMLAPAWRERMIARIGLVPWKGVYALISIAGFVLIVVGFGMARAQPQLLYTPPEWLRRKRAVSSRCRTQAERATRSAAGCRCRGPWWSATGSARR